jgi:hypothetical protein
VGLKRTWHREDLPVDEKVIELLFLRQLTCSQMIEHLSIKNYKKSVQKNDATLALGAAACLFLIDFNILPNVSSTLRVV